MNVATTPLNDAPAGGDGRGAERRATAAQTSADGSFSALMDNKRKQDSRDTDQPGTLAGLTPAAASQLNRAMEWMPLEVSSLKGVASRSELSGPMDEGSIANVLANATSAGSRSNGRVGVRILALQVNGENSKPAPGSEFQIGNDRSRAAHFSDAALEERHGLGSVRHQHKACESRDLDQQSLQLGVPDAGVLALSADNVYNTERPNTRPLLSPAQQILTQLSGPIRTLQNSAPVSDGTAQGKFLRVALLPEELGVVTVTLRISGKHLRIDIAAEQVETAKLLTRDQQTLDTLLRTSGSNGAWGSCSISIKDWQGVQLADPLASIAKQELLSTSDSWNQGGRQAGDHRHSAETGSYLGTDEETERPEHVDNDPQSHRRSAAGIVV